MDLEASYLLGSFHDTGRCYLAYLVIISYKPCEL